MKLFREGLKNWFMLPDYTRDLIIYILSSTVLSVVSCGLFFYLRRIVFHGYIMDHILFNMLNYRDALVIIQGGIIVSGVFILSFFFMMINKRKYTSFNQHIKYSEEAFNDIKKTSSQLIDAYREMSAISSQCQQSQALLYEHKKFLLDLIDTLPCMIIYKDSDGIYKLVNKGAADLLYTVPSEMVGKTLEELSWTNEEKERFMITDAEVLKGKIKIGMEQISTISGDKVNIFKFKYPFKKGILIYAINLDCMCGDYNARIAEMPM